MRRIALGVAALALMTGPARSTPVFGSNVIANGDAESGAGSATGNDIEAVPGWITSGNFTVVQYGAGGAGQFPGAGDPGPAARGTNFFAGGPNNGSSSAAQTIDLSPLAIQINGGGVTYFTDGFFGGWQTHDDNAVLTVVFLNDLLQTIGSSTIGGVTAADRGNQTGLLERTDQGVLPAATRELLVTLTMTRRNGDYNDAYADNLSLVLQGPSTRVPEPQSVALVGVALLMAGVIRRRR